MAIEFIKCPEILPEDHIDGSGFFLKCIINPPILEFTCAEPFYDLNERQTRRLAYLFTQAADKLAGIVVTSNDKGYTRKVK